jgi:tetratricopeptide (TPR) repeat protein
MQAAGMILAVNNERIRDMKRQVVILFMVVLVLAGLAATLVHMNRPHTSPTALSELASEPPPPSPASETQPGAEPAPPPMAAASAQTSEPAQPRQEARPAPVSLPANLETALVGQTLDRLISSQVSYQEKQAAWKSLRDSGKLDQAITELEQRMAGDPRDAAYPATLGQAYLKKCAMLDDIRAQGILALQADRLFETALTIDPANWEARFTKAVAMSYWPASMNKGNEVVQQFNTLIQQQQTQPPQPQFADPFIQLGSFYQKNGDTESARTVWQQGAGLFPDNQELRNQLLAATAPQAANAPAGQ